jgi:hypothetical protein
MSDDLGISEPQVHMLVSLLDLPVMDHAVSELLRIYPRSKLGGRVLDPLKEKGLIRYHTLPRRKGKSGAPRLAWGLVRGVREDIERSYKKAKLSCEMRILEAESIASDLCQGLQMNCDMRSEVK